jgi:hypothetical protein
MQVMENLEVGKEQGGSIVVNLLSQLSDVSFLDRGNDLHNLKKL